MVQKCQQRRRSAPPFPRARASSPIRTVHVNRVRCAPRAKVRPVAYASTPDGSAAAAVATVTDHSVDQTAWLGRIQYYGGREMWRKAEDKFQQVIRQFFIASLCDMKLYCFLTFFTSTENMG